LIILGGFLFPFSIKAQESAPLTFFQIKKVLSGISTNTKTANVGFRLVAVKNGNS
jgi:hypothetical protein